MTTNRVEKLLDALKDVTTIYHQACQVAVREILEVNLRACQGPCARILFPRRQWAVIPEEYRAALTPWVTLAYTQTRCVTCYRRATRSGEHKPIPRPKKSKILSQAELDYLRKQVGLR